MARRLASMPQRRRRASVRAGGASRAELLLPLGLAQAIDHRLALPRRHDVPLVDWTTCVQFASSTAQLHSSDGGTAWTAGCARAGWLID